MPTRPPSPCSTPGCPLRVPCHDHAPKPWAGSRSRDTRGPDWPRTRARILRRDGHRCYRCGLPADQVDHVVPAAEDGTNDETNLAAICGPCHQAKSADEAKRGQQRRSARRLRP